MHNFTSIVRQLRCLLGADDGYKPRGGYFPRIGGKNPVDLFPYLKLRRLQTDSQERRQEVGVSTADLAEKRARYRTEETCRNRFKKKQEAVYASGTEPKLRIGKGRTCDYGYSRTTFTYALADGDSYFVVEFLT